jgi:carbonic anhydrase
MNRPKRMLVANVAWAHETATRDPEFFNQLARGQKPHVLWIGCSDSRVPAETITDCVPGDLFVHRNIANLFHPDDDNSVSVLEYAVKVLKVGHVIVCGHYGCGGVRASLLPLDPALPHVNRRIAPLCALAGTHRGELQKYADGQARVDRLAELSVLEQVRQLRTHPIVCDGAPAPLVHGWIFALDDGRIKVLTSGYEASHAAPHAKAEAGAAAGGPTRAAPHTAHSARTATTA